MPAIGRHTDSARTDGEDDPAMAIGEQPEDGPILLLAPLS
jgi:hypothetical protein